MVCGESGLGKSTLVNSLFCADIYSTDYPGPSKRTVEKTVQVETTKVVLQVSGIFAALVHSLRDIHANFALRPQTSRFMNGEYSADHQLSL